MVRSVLWLGFLVGCGGSVDGVTKAPQDTGSTDIGCAPEVVIGTGEDAFLELPSGSELTMIHGPQGGWHMLASVRVAGTSPEVHIQYEIVHEETGSLVSNNSYNLALQMEDDCRGAYVGMYGILDIGPLVEGDLDTPPEILDGDLLRIRMDVQDVDFVQISGEVQVVAARDPIDA